MQNREEIVHCQIADSKDCTWLLWSEWCYRPTEALADVQTSRLSYSPLAYQSCV